MREDSIQQFMTLYRRDDWWGRETDFHGMYNFDKIELIVVRDRELAFEKFKAGELDYYVVLSAAVG